MRTRVVRFSAITTRTEGCYAARTILETADPVYGGWGREHKFPQTEAIDFALVRWSQTGDNAMLQLVTRTLRAMQAGEIHDAIEALL